MSTAAGHLHEDGGPSVARQIVRASVGTLTVVAVLGALAAAAVYGRDTATMLWWRMAGDSAVTLAEGTSFSDEPPAAVAPVMSAGPVSFATSLEELAAPFGGDAVVVTTAAGLRAKAPYAAEELTGDRPDLPVPLAVTPAGVLRVEPAVDSMAGGLRVWGGPGAPVAETESEQAALIARLSSAVLHAGGTTVEVTAIPTRMPTSGPGSMWSVELGLPGCDVCRVSTWDLVTFDRNGRLANASFTLAAITDLAPIAAPSAAEAFEDARHHRGPTTVWMDGAPIGSATLSVGDLGSLQPFTAWNLLDTRGTVVAQVPVSDAAA
ncbi:MAG: hypothetical protein AB7O74_00870 [Candidatus Nanopelagicales bacterium]